MLLALAQLLADDIRAFNVFNYITLRAVLATLTSLVISFIVGPILVSVPSMCQGKSSLMPSRFLWVSPWHIVTHTRPVGWSARLGLRNVARAPECAIYRGW